jgi:phage-related protein (TIGR01555 family)
MANGHGGARHGAGRRPEGQATRTGVKQSRDALLAADARARAGAGYETGTPLATVTAGKFRDAFVNYQHQLGVGANNILTTSSASFNPISRIRVLLEWMYRAQFVCKNAVDVIPEDMTREGAIITGPMKPKDMRKIEMRAMKLNLWANIRACLKWARLYGGCIGFIVIKGQEPSTPLRMETVGEDQFMGIYPLDRWMVDPSLELLVTDFGSPDIGKPMFYRVTADAPALPRMKIHHTRAIRFISQEQPYWQSVQENLWGLSVFESIQDCITSFDLARIGAAQLIDKSFIRTFKLEGLKELIGSNSVAYEGVRAYVDFMRSMQGIEGITLMDTKDEYEGHEHGAFSGIADILIEFRQHLSGALQTPQTKLFGQAPSGMNATGESDMRNYYDMIKSRQVTDLGYPLTGIVYPLLAQSCSVKWKEEYGIAFKPLWQPTELEKSTIAKNITDTVLAAEEKGTVSTKTAMMELKQQSHLTGVWSNITEEDIEAAVDVPVPAANIVMPGDPGQPSLAGGSPKPKPPGGGAPKPAAKPAAKPAGNGAKPAPAKGKEPAKKAAKAGSKTKDDDGEWSGTAGATGPAHGNITYSDPSHPPTVLPRPDVMPSGVMPGARPFDDSTPYRHGNGAGQIGPVTERFLTLPIHIETRKGEQRMSRDPSDPWIARMAADYGYIVGTGSAEGPNEGMDCFVGKGSKMFAINQAHKHHPGHFDEVKLMLGFDTEGQALATYIASHDDPNMAANRIMSVAKVTLGDIEGFLKGDVSKPFPTKDFYQEILGSSRSTESANVAELEHTLTLTGDPTASMDPALSPGLNRIA